MAEGRRRGGSAALDSRRRDQPRAVLRDRRLDEDLRRVGIVQTPLLSASQVDELWTGYRAIVPSGETGLQIDHLRSDRAVVRRTSELIEHVIGDPVRETFDDHRPLLMSFVVKHPGVDSGFHFHRDLCAKDERTGPGYTLWIPLVDVGPGIDNGGLHVVPRSDRLPTGTFGVDTSMLLVPFQEALREAAQPVAARAGTGVVYTARLVHGSPPNRSPVPRPAIGCMVVPEEDALTHVVPTGRRHRTVFAVDADFFVDWHPKRILDEGLASSYELVDEFDEQVSMDELTVQETLGLAHLPSREMQIPGDVVSDVDRTDPLPKTRGFRSTRTTDLVVDDHTSESFEGRIAGWTPVEAIGGVRVVRLRSLFRRTGPRRPLGEDVDELLRRRTTADAALVVVPPGARLSLEVVTRPWSHDDLLVIDAPPTRSGVRCGSQFANLDPGDRIGLRRDRYHLWCDGPGDLVVLLRSRLGKARGART